jgi:flagellar hook protein FlgE
MSLTSAMLTGVAALDANSQAMSITSSNIANVNTVGYKDSEANFSTFLTSSYGSNIDEAGVLVNSQQNVSQQGVLQAATSTTDLGIQGNGFFVTSQSPTATSNLYYTRAGDFSPDSGGDLVNGAGYYLLGYPITNTGGTSTTGSALQPINVSNLEGSAEPSTEMTLQANLESSATVDSTYTPGDMTNGVVTPDFTRTINVYDSQGGSQPLDVSFVKTGANTWSYEVSYQGAAANISPATNPIATGTMTFNAGKRQFHGDAGHGECCTHDPVLGGFRPHPAGDLDQHGNCRELERGYAIRQPVDADEFVRRRSGLWQPHRRHDRNRRYRHRAIFERAVAECLPAAAGDLRQSGRP